MLELSGFIFDLFSFLKEESHTNNLETNIFQNDYPLSFSVVSRFSCKIDIID